jgi:hypothetical protein
VDNIDVHAPQRDSRSKIQLEEQQAVRRADFRDTQWSEVHYPNKFSFRPFYNASILELVVGALLLLFGIVLVIRLFIVPDEQKTGADLVGAFGMYILVGAGVLLSGLYFVSKVIKAFRENKIYILPNGFPINIATILDDYATADPKLFEKIGYFDVEAKRAENPIVAPGEISYNYSPSNTYAPSNMPRGEQSDNKMLEEMLDIEEPEETELPAHVNFFDHIDDRESGHVIVGVNEQEEPIQIPIMSMFNHLVGGAIGTGKSIYLRSLVYQLLNEADESEIPLEIGLADIENNTFPEFRGCRHVRWYASNYVEIEHMTSNLLKEVERRKVAYESLSSTPKDIERYNVLARRDGKEELPIIVILYDEFSALMHRSQAQQKRILSDILQLALRSRKYGIFLIIAGQTFKADLIDSAVLGQFNFNVCFKVRSGAASYSVLGQVGAEKLKQPGEALIKAKDGTIQHIQGLFIDDDELLDALKEYRDPESEQVIPVAVREIIDFAHEHLGDKVQFRELEVYMRDRGVSRADLIRYLDYMDEHKLTLRGERNSRVLNWNRIDKE